MEREQLMKAAEMMKTKKKGIAFTGAGMSTASGIPDFRSAGGIWSQYSVREYAYIDSFLENPEKVWEFFRLREKEFLKAEPNAGHRALAELEKMGFLTAVVTQNIDGLHQRGGSDMVLELHGSMNALVCLSCGKKFNRDDETLKSDANVPHCACKAVLKPSVVLFGEPLPQEVFNSALEEGLKTDFVLVAGTSASVYPAAQIPYTAKRNGSVVVEINREATPLTSSITDLFLQGPVEVILPELVAELKKIL